MAKVIPGRFAAEMEGPFVVFIIGMRINRLFAFHKWIPVASAMGPMIKELYQNPEIGFISTEFLLNWRGITLIQYWRTYEQLETYARGGTHLTTWKKFNTSVGTDGTVGIYHETYRIQPEQYEAIYVNMPKSGLAKGGMHVPAVGTKETSKRRMGGDNNPAVPTPTNPE
ncbi:transcriptional regulator [Paenibacillus macquariensis subsp. defensor]|nr:transcriptional regulator [Paenibacillus macquariensis subsp. defensor]